MASKYQVQRRIRYKLRKKARRVAACADSSQPVEGSDKTTAGPALQKTKEMPAKKTADSKKPPTSKVPKHQKPKIKMINLRERVRILENALVWSEQRFVREAERHREQIQQLSRDNLLLRAEVNEMKRAFSLELVRQRAINQEVWAQNNGSTRAGGDK